MHTIAILTGGDSAERVISLQSSAVVRKHLPEDRFRSLEIDIEGTHWRERYTGTPVDKNDFSVTIDGEQWTFDAAFAALHGSPLEDGKLQGYFDIMGIPYTCCNGMVSALVMNKHLTKQFLASSGLPMARSVLLEKGEDIDWDAIEQLGLPVFVKPNSQGSSFGVTKVKAQDQLKAAMTEAWKYDEEIVVESFLEGREFSNGVITRNGKPMALPITEIIPKGEFFDYAAKYEGEALEITPADLTPAETNACQARSVQLYQALGCQGLVRFDYILSKNEFYFLEANTVPGLSEASLVPQQALERGWSLAEFFSILLEEAIGRKS